MTGRLPPIALDRAHPRSSPVYRQIYERIRSAILAGTLPAGTRLPSWSGLALQLGVARGTVKAAYDWLAGEGYIVGRGAAGTLVSSLIKRPKPKRDTGRHPAPPRARSTDPTRRHPAVGDPIAPFQMGFPALDAFPRKLWTRVAAQCARRLDDTAMGYTDLMGYRPLREAIAAYVAVARGIVCTADQVLVTCGYTGALELTCRALLEPGDRVWVEDPVYFRTLALLRLANVHLVPLPVDAAGMRVSAGTALAPEARLAVVTPSHQAPLGMPLSLPRRLELLEWAARKKRWIVEDDYYGEFNLTARPMSALCSLDESGRVVYAGTFSKTLLPSLRLGYLILPVARVERFRQVARALLPAPPALTQHTVSEFMRLGHFARHMQRMRRLYAERKQGLVAALEAEFGDTLQIDRTGTGLHIIAHLRAGMDDVAFERAAAQAGLGAQALSAATIRTRRRPAILLSFTNVDTERATAEVRRLAAAARSVRILA